MKLSLNGLVAYLKGKGWKVKMNESADDEEVFEIEEKEEEEEEDEMIPEPKVKKNSDDLLSEEELSGMKRLATILAKNEALLEAFENGTLDEALKAVPAAAELVKNAQLQEKTEKDRLIATIKLNGSVYTDEELASMTIPVLTKLNAQMTVNYSGLGLGSFQNNQGEQPLGIRPALLTAIEKEEK